MKNTKMDKRMQAYLDKVTFELTMAVENLPKDPQHPRRMGIIRAYLKDAYLEGFVDAQEEAQDEQYQEESVS